MSNCRGWESILRLTPCDVWERLKGRTLWISGDSQSLDFFKAVICFMFEFWEEIGRFDFLKPTDLRFKETIQVAHLFVDGHGGGWVLVGGGGGGVWRKPEACRIPVSRR